VVHFGVEFTRSKNRSGTTVHLKIGKTTDISLQEARNVVKRLRAEQALGVDHHAQQQARKAVLTFSEFFENHYLPYVKPRKRSWYSDESLYRVHLKDAFGGKRLNFISRQEIQSFHTAMKETGRAAATCNHMIKLMKHSLNLAIDWGMLDKNPASRIPQFFEDNKKEVYLSDEEMQRLMTVLRTDENRPVCLAAIFMLSTGARVGETLSARWVDISRTNRVWRIPATNSKSKKIRAVPLNDSALEVLDQLETEGNFEYLFRSQLGARFTTISKVFSRIRKKAGLPFISLHTLRHQHASMLVNSGRGIYEVKQLLGHADIKTTERYSHLSTKTLQAASDSASEMIQSAMQVKLDEAA